MNKDKKNNDGGRILYQLWGHDTFSNELYCCGIYRHRSSAYRAKRKHEEDVKDYQSEGLRDTFWVSAITEDEYELQLINRRKTIEIKHRLLEDNQKFIEDNCEAIYEALTRVACEEIKMPCKNEEQRIGLVDVPENLLIDSISSISQNQAGNMSSALAFQQRNVNTRNAMVQPPVTSVLKQQRSSATASPHPFQKTG